MNEKLDEIREERETKVGSIFKYFSAIMGFFYMLFGVVFYFFPFIEKMDEWRAPFMSILLKYFADYNKNGLKEPPEVTRFTNKYKQNSDVFADFIDKYIVESDKNYKEKQDYIYETFVGYYKTTHPKKPIPSSKDLITYFTNKKYNVEKYTIRGIEVSNNKEDYDE